MQNDFYPWRPPAIFQMFDDDLFHSSYFSAVGICWNMVLMVEVGAMVAYKPDEQIN